MGISKIGGIGGIQKKTGGLSGLKSLQSKPILSQKPAMVETKPKIPAENEDM